jgi:hypothetical protein
MESIFLILSGVILAAGVLYWMWSHIQLTQKKVQLLENAVFELRGMLANSGGGASGGGHCSSGSIGVPAAVPSSPTKNIQLNAAASAVLAARDATDARNATDDEDDEDGWEEAVGVANASPSNGERVERMSVPLDALDTPVIDTYEMSVVDDLQPGGRAAPAPAPASSPSPADVDMNDTVDDEQQSESFRRLFASQEVVEVPAAVAAPATPETSKVVAMPVAAAAAGKAQESLESMPVKELRRLAEQRGIAGAADMRKKDILSALRQQVSSTVSLTLPEPGTEAGEVREITIASVGGDAIETDTAEILE